MKHIGFNRLGDPIYRGKDGETIEVHKDRLGITRYRDENGKELGYYSTRLGRVVEP